MPPDTGDHCSPRSHDVLEHKLKLADESNCVIAKTLARRIAKSLEIDPAADFPALLTEALQSYLRRELPMYSHHDDDSASSTGSTSVSPVAGTLDVCATGLLNDILVSVDSDLSSCVLDLLSDNPECDVDTPSLLRDNLPRLIDRGKRLSWHGHQSVVQLSETIVVKMGPHLTREEDSLLEFLSIHTSIPVPRPLGRCTIDGTAFAFRTSVSGEPLNEVWSKLSPEQKMSVRQQLDCLWSELRHIPHPFNTPLGTLSSPHLCKHSRTTSRVSSSAISTISEFHDFLLLNSLRGVSSGYRRWMRSLLKDDYGVVLSHGNFAMRHIMVDKSSNGGMRIVGVVGWEMGGWYPEYWEHYIRHLATEAGKIIAIGGITFLLLSWDMTTKLQSFELLGIP